MKLTKAQIKAHEEACRLLEQDALTLDERIFVLDNWHEGATHINSSAGAFFTPRDLAQHMAIELPHQGRVVDLCAGIGALSFAALHNGPWGAPTDVSITCIERNPEYVAVGRKIVPEATWIEADIFDVLGMSIGRFDVAYSNPPFGNVKRAGSAPRYTGKDFEFHVIDIAAHMAEFGVFILPQMSAGFSYSGQQSYKRHTEGRAFDVQEKLGLYFEAGCGVDTAVFKDQWRGVSPICEIVCVDFSDKHVAAGQLDLFEAAA